MRALARAGIAVTALAAVASCAPKADDDATTVVARDGTDLVSHEGDTEALAAALVAWHDRDATAARTALGSLAATAVPPAWFATAVEVPIYVGASLVDLPGATLMPGLIEGHSHILLHAYNETPWDDQVLREGLALLATHCEQTIEALTGRPFTVELSRRRSALEIMPDYTASVWTAYSMSERWRVGGGAGRRWRRERSSRLAARRARGRRDRPRPSAGHRPAPRSRRRRPRPRRRRWSPRRGSPPPRPAPRA